MSGIVPLRQADYGGEKDCTLTSIVTLYRGDKEAEDFYAEVEGAAKTYFYAPNRGTPYLFIWPILNKATGLKSSFRFFKHIGFGWQKIKSLIDEQKPFILSMRNDGRDYYKNHSVSVIGYIEYDNGAKMLMIYDNWYRSVSYIDYNKLSFISGINYI